jgi:hypothetical protein
MNNPTSHKRILNRLSSTLSLTGHTTALLPCKRKDIYAKKATAQKLSASVGHKDDMFDLQYFPDAMLST